VLAEIDDADVVRQLLLDEVAGRVREQHLATVARSAEASAPIDAKTDVPLAAHERLARMEPHPDADRYAVGPWLRSERALQVDRGGDRVTRSGEHDEERVALRVDLVPVVALDRSADQPGMGLE
jgi:hypothetical protein